MECMTDEYEQMLSRECGDNFNEAQRSEAESVATTFQEFLKSKGWQVSNTVFSEYLEESFNAGKVAAIEEINWKFPNRDSIEKFSFDLADKYEKSGRQPLHGELVGDTYRYIEMELGLGVWKKIFEGEK